MCEALKKYTAEEAIDRLEEAGIANAMLRDMQGVWDHPQLKARNRWREIETEAGTIPTLITPGMSADVEARLDPVPAVGQHNEKILAELKDLD